MSGARVSPTPLALMGLEDSARCRVGANFPLKESQLEENQFKSLALKSLDLIL